MEQITDLRLLPGFRKMLEELADLAVLLLDEFDGDIDLEETGDLEPSLGSDHYGRTDLEGDDCDSEPSLGSADTRIDQTGWSMGHSDDREEEHDGREPDHDDEPSLGSTSSNGDQSNWTGAAATKSVHFADDRELDDCDDEEETDLEEQSGIGDDDGLQEQVNRCIGTGARFVPADAVAVAAARQRLGVILDRVGGRR